VRTLHLGNLYGPRAIRRGVGLARFIAAHDIDVVHCHDQYSNVFTTAWARVARAPVVIASRRWWHSLPSHAYQIANRIGFRLADCVLANSPSVAATLADVDGVDASRIAVIPNFVDESAFIPPSDDRRRRELRELGVPDDALVAGIVARLTPVKDHASALRAVASLTPTWPRLHLVLFGDGEHRLALEQLAGDLGIAERVHFAGMRSNTRNLHWLADISLLCSLSEGFPNSVVEAMAAARPVIATDVGGNPDAVRDGETGLLVRPCDPRGLAAAIHRLASDADLRLAMGRAGQRRARAQYHRDVVLPAIETLYERLVRDAEARRN
jgi:glycosyltransferase involved in cell wall biosynthesis